VIGLDTNVILRYLVKDDPEQTPKAREAIRGLSAEEPGYITMVVMAEVWWALSRSYKFEKSSIIGALEALADTPEIVLERYDLVRRALMYAEDGADFADALIELNGNEAGCRYTVTFDRGAAKNLGMRLLT
jgi:predicted nucleic-acid-binding protein